MMSPEVRPEVPLRPRRRVALLGSASILALLASIIVATVAPPSWSRADKPTSSVPAPTAATPPAKIAGNAPCFGYVDNPEGVAALYPLQAGRVVEVLTKEGANVEAGAPLFRVDDTLAKLHLREAKTALAAAETQLARAKSLPEQHRSKIAAQQALIEVARQELAGAKEQQAKVQNLFKQGGSGSAEDLKGSAALVLKAEAAVRAREAELAGLNAVDPQLGIALADEDVAAKRVDVEKAELGVKECTVFAPTKGSILRLSVTTGEVLGPTPRQPALMFCPEAPRIIRAEVEQEFADHVAVGQSAVIQDDATSAGNWTGKVTRLSDWYTHRRSVLLEPLQYNDVRTLECIIELTPGQAPLRIGQRVRVMIGNLEP